jgi:hypothetical protein
MMMMIMMIVDHDVKSQATPHTNKQTNRQEGAAAAAVLVAYLTSL